MVESNAYELSYVYLNIELAREIGVPDSYLKLGGGHNWGFLIGGATIKYLKNFPKGSNTAKAMDEIFGLTTVAEIEAVGLGLKKDQLFGHDWDNLLTSKKTISYLTNRLLAGAHILSAMNEIRGLNEQGIEFVERDRQVPEDVMNRWNVKRGLRPLNSFLTEKQPPQTGIIPLGNTQRKQSMILNSLAEPYQPRPVNLEGVIPPGNLQRIQGRLAEEGRRLEARRAEVGLAESVALPA